MADFSAANGDVAGLLTDLMLPVVSFLPEGDCEKIQIRLRLIIESAISNYFIDVTVGVGRMWKQLTVRGMRENSGSFVSHMIDELVCENFHIFEIFRLWKILESRDLKLIVVTVLTFHSPVLEPDLNLSLRQLKAIGEVDATRSTEVFINIEFLLELN